MAEAHIESFTQVTLILSLEEAQCLKTIIQNGPELEPQQISAKREAIWLALEKTGVPSR